MDAVGSSVVESTREESFPEKSFCQIICKRRRWLLRSFARAETGAIFKGGLRVVNMFLKLQFKTVEI
jgi:hypothetical protein